MRFLGMWTNVCTIYETFLSTESQEYVYCNPIFNLITYYIYYFSSDVSIREEILSHISALKEPSLKGSREVLPRVRKESSRSETSVGGRTRKDTVKSIASEMSCGKESQTNGKLTKLDEKDKEKDQLIEAEKTESGTVIYLLLFMVTCT